MKIKLFIIFLILFKFSNAQKLGNTFWTDDENFFRIYMNNQIIEILIYDNNKISDFIQRYGFYESCNLPSLDSLKDRGKYYFELDSSDFEDEETRKVRIYLRCAELNIYTYEGDTLMTIFYSSRQHFFTYKKIDSLPEIVTKYLKEKGIEVKK